MCCEMQKYIPDFRMNVNISYVQILQGNVERDILDAIQKYSLQPECLCVEMTESGFMDMTPSFCKFRKTLDKNGIPFVIDDFGTGYSSLNHIREMPLDIIKIDKCFIEHLGEDDFSDAFVKMVTELANTIGVHVCVEGVETDRQYAIIKKMGIYYIQGYFFDKPMCIESFEEKYI